MVKGKVSRGSEEIGQVVTVKAKLFGNGGESCAVFLGFENADGSAVDEQQVIAPA